MSYSPTDGPACHRLVEVFSNRAILEAVTEGPGMPLEELLLWLQRLKGLRWLRMGCGIGR